MSSRRLVLTAAVACGLLGLAIGLLARRPAARTRPALFLITSHRSWSDVDLRLRVLAGATAADPRRGVVLFEASSRGLGSVPPAPLHPGPLLFGSPDRSGPFRVVAASKWSWVLESRGGTRVTLDLSDYFDLLPTFRVLGRQLDPRRLPALRGGVAVPVVYGPAKQRAVLLVGYSNRDPAWHLAGYLAGFSLPSARTPGTALRRPLLGPGGVLYRIDAGARRLVPAGRGRPPQERIRHPGCTTWPAARGASYRACGGSIVLRHGESRRTLYRSRPAAYGAWGFLEPSPGGRTLLLEGDLFGCGVLTRALFLRDGRLETAIPATASDSELHSQPLGWLHDGSALVAVQNDAGCEGALASGIYRAWPGESRPPELVVATSGADATIWGSLR